MADFAGGPATMPLEGIRVLDITTVIAAPFAAALLGDFGAEVIKVELPGSGDPLRTHGPFVDGTSMHFAVTNRNKHSITLDLRKPKGKELILKLAAQSDVICENFRPGTLEGWGLGAEEFKRVNPGIVMLRVSGYGQTGPYSEKAGFGTPCQSFSGLTYLLGYPDRPPLNIPLALADYLAGLFGVFAVMTALYHRDGRGSGRGQVVDIGLYEAVFRLLETLPAEYGKLGAVRERNGGQSRTAAPGGIYRTADGEWVCLVTSTQRTFVRLAELMDHPELVDDPRFDTNPHRVQHREALDAIINEWMATYPRQKLLSMADKAGVPLCSVMSVADIFQDPQYKARENIVEVDHPSAGPVPMPGIIPKLSETPGRVRRAAPSLGEHNEDIYGGLLGLSQSELAELRAEGVI